MRPRFHDLSFAVVVLLAAAPSAFGQAGAGETPPVDPPPPQPTACYYVTWPMGGGDLAPMINGSGDDFAHAHALGPFCQGEARATNASMAAGDGDLKTWGVMHFAVPACPPVEFTATGRLGAMSSAAIDVGTGSRLSRCETHQVLHSTALGQLEITTSASVGTAQSYQTTPPGAQFGLAAGRIVFDAATPVMLTRRMTTEGDTWVGASSVNLSAGSTTPAWAAARVDYTSFQATTASRCPVHNVVGTASADGTWTTAYGNLY